MYESDIEELISRYPEEFFPNKALTLIGRQESFSGVGRFDLLFKDMITPLSWRNTRKPSMREA